MDFFELIAKRQSIRTFDPQSVQDHDVGQILAAANSAPSARNFQAYEIYVVRSPDRRKQLSAAAKSQNSVATAPVVLVFCANPARNVARYRERGRNLYAIQDATIACTFAMLAATALGLATVWIGAFWDEQVRAVIGAPEGLQPVAILPIGYAAESPERTTRRAVNDLAHEV